MCLGTKLSRPRYIASKNYWFIGTYRGERQWLIYFRKDNMGHIAYIRLLIYDRCLTSKLSTKSSCYYAAKNLVGFF
jgi:hypothetical protein